MKLHYRGAYDGHPASLPYRAHQPNAVPFREAKDAKALSLIANGICLALIFLLGIPAFLRGWAHFDVRQLFIGFGMSMLAVFPHEFLHATCFREDVYLYTNWRNGLLFVVGPETMSKGRFVLMSLLPNLLFGVLPYLIGMRFPQYLFLLIFGTCSIGMGAGDYYNIFNALTQMPKGARTYLYRFNSFWYLPE